MEPDRRTPGIQPERVRTLSKMAIRQGSYVLYWMQASQRAACNHALEYAIDQANHLKKPLVVYFGITDDYPEANERHYRFMLEGLRETQSALRGRGIQMVIGHESPETGAVRLSRDASLLIVDKGYLRFQRAWRSHVADNADCPVLEVESDAIVPVALASAKEDYSAATFRPKIRARIPEFLVPLEEQAPRASSLHLDFDSFDVDDTGKALLRLNIHRGTMPVPELRGGTSEARTLLDRFIARKLELYPELRNDPNADSLSNMSPYLHFGQISPLHIALRIMDAGSPSMEAYLEELIVRRELGVNFVFYNRHYDSFAALPDWARKTLSEHESDRREYSYSREDLESAQTHDPYWNAAQREMAGTGKMHGYMRMYWGKKILEWSRTPEEAFAAALYLNNKYELDGRDPNGFTGVAWCFGKHDRPWGERPVFGKIRYMSAGGLRRKFDADAYAKRFE